MSLTPKSFYPIIFLVVALFLSSGFLIDALDTADAQDISDTTTTSQLGPQEIVPEAPTLIFPTTSTTVETTTTTTLAPFLFNPCKYDNTHRYTVADGDYLIGIADLYNTEVLDIVGCNQWTETSNHLLLPGDKIILPPDSFLDPIVTTTTTAPIPVTTLVTQPPTPVTQPPASTSPPSNPSGRVTHPDCWWEGAIRTAFANAGASVATQDFFVYVAWRESKCTQTAHNPNLATQDDSYGLFQLNLLPRALGPLMSSWGYGSHNLLNGFTNIEAAVRLWQMCGKGPWIKPYSC